MVTGYRLTEEEFLLLAYKYRLTAVPVWLTSDPEAIDPEKPLRTLGRKSMLLRQNETYIVHPLIDFLFSQLSQADRFAGGTDWVFCYFCPQATLVLEQSGAALRLLPFQTPQDCFAYLRESGYAREALQPSTRQADGSIQNETEKTLWTQWEEGT